jgi:hypothetical protein
MKKDQDRMSKQDLNLLRSLLIRYASCEMDQFDNLRVATPNGPVYVSLGVRPVDGADAESYDWMDELPEQAETP